MTGTLRERLIGAWELFSYIEKPIDGSAPVYPMGEQPSGLILYTPDGYMSAQIMAPGRAPIASGDWLDATASGYIAYSGPFHVDEQEKTLTHTMTVSLFPNWTGQTQPRVMKIEGNSLHLSTASPMQSGGKMVMPYLEWRRAKRR